MNTERTKLNHFESAAALKELVLNAQNGQQQAIDQLCAAFKPLIMQEAHYSYIAQALGEEAENTAWMLFLEFIMSYKGKNYLVLPGLIKVHLHYSLLHKVYPDEKNEVDAYLLLDQTDEEGRPLFDIASDELVDSHLIDHNMIHNLLKHLTAKQKEVIEATILGCQTLDEFSRKKGLSFTTVYLHQQRGLKKLRKVLKKSL